MGRERPIKRDEAQILDEALAEEQTVERIAGRRQGVHFGKNVGRFDVEERQSHSREKFR